VIRSTRMFVERVESALPPVSCEMGVRAKVDLAIRIPEGAAMTTHVTETAPAPSDLTVKHFQEMLAFETDCWDVHESLKSDDPDFIVVDVRGPNAFANGHVKGAINIPHRDMTATRMAEYPKDKLFVVYCAGPHCNGANKAALRLARLGLPVKMMIGGVTGWIDEGFTLTPS
jgi:rhodanese-related sulfurtransferase